MGAYKADVRYSAAPGLPVGVETSHATWARVADWRQAAAAASALPPPAVEPLHAPASHALVSLTLWTRITAPGTSSLVMSSKVLKSQLHSVIRQRIEKQEGAKGKQQGKRAAKRAKKQQPPTEEQQAQTLAANLKYFARTTTTRGAAADLVAEVRRRRRCRHVAGRRRQARLLPCCTGSVQMSTFNTIKRYTCLPHAGASQKGLPAAAQAGGAARQGGAGRRRGGLG